MKIKNNNDLSLKITPGFFPGLFILLVLIVTSGQAYAQQEPVKADSTVVYENIETFSKRSKITRLFYGLIFKPVAPEKDKGT